MLPNAVIYHSIERNELYKTWYHQSLSWLILKAKKAEYQASLTSFIMHTNQYFDSIDHGRNGSPKKRFCHFVAASILHRLVCQLFLCDVRDARKPNQNSRHWSDFSHISSTFRHYPLFIFIISSRILPTFLIRVLYQSIELEMLYKARQTPPLHLTENQSENSKYLNTDQIISRSSNTNLRYRLLSHWETLETRYTVVNYEGKTIRTPTTFLCLSESYGDCLLHFTYFQIQLG